MFGDSNTQDYKHRKKGHMAYSQKHYAAGFLDTGGNDIIYEGVCANYQHECQGYLAHEKRHKVFYYIDNQNNSNRAENCLDYRYRKSHAGKHHCIEAYASNRTKGHQRIQLGF